MKLSGNNSRAFIEAEESTFLLDNFSISGMTGVAAFGFSGDNKTISFNFEDGKIYDPNGRYVFSYQENSSLDIKGNIDKTSYDYYINDKLISNNGTKEDFKLEKFFINTTGCQIDTSLSIFGDRPTFSSSMNDSFLTTHNLFGSITNTTTGSGVLNIFTGRVVGLNNRYFSFSTVPKRITPYSSGSFVLDHKNGPSKTYNLSLLFDTNMGLISITGVSDGLGADLFSATNFLSSLGDNFLGDISLPLGDNDGNFELAFENYGCSGLRGFTSPGQASEEFRYTNLTTSGTTIITPEVKVSLGYSSGNVGTYWMLSGIHLTNAGSGYSDAPYIYFPDAQGNDQQPSVQATTSTDSDGAYYVTDTQLTGSVSNLYGSGVYYNNSISGKIDEIYFNDQLVKAIKASEIIFSGSKHGSSPSLVNALGSGILQGYQKHFSGVFDLSTGINANYNYRSFNDDLLTGVSGDAAYDYDNLLDFCGSTLPYQPGIYENTKDVAFQISRDVALSIKVNFYNRFFDSDEMVAKLIISGQRDTYSNSDQEIVYFTGKKTS